MNFFKRTRTAIYTTGSRMSAEEVAAALESLGPQHPAARAVLQVLADSIENAAAQVSHPELADTPGMLAHTAGGLEWLRATRAGMEDLIAGKATG